MFIHPFEHPDVIAGQGTVGLEIAEQCPEARTIAVPVGGGGLAAGIAVAAQAPAAGASAVIGVQAEAVAPFPGSLAAGHPVAVDAAADHGRRHRGRRARRPHRSAILARLARPGGDRLRGEPVPRAAAVPGAGQAAGRAGRRGRGGRPAGAPGLFEPPVVVVLSGGNIDPLLLAKVLRHGLAAAGRYLAFRCRLPDRPGALAALLAAAGRASAPT